MRKIKKIILGLAVAMGFSGLLRAPTTYAYICAPGSARGRANVSSPAECAQPKEEREVGSSVAQIINVVLSVLGVIAVLVIVIGGIMYATSAGDTAKVVRAKNVIQYAIIGLIISLLAWAIVNFVLGSVFGS